MEKINKDQRLPLEWYKQNVNLVEFAQAMYGFEINYRHMPKFSSSTPNWVTMENENGENFIFSRNFQNTKDESGSHFYYINTTGNSHEPVFGNNRNDRGSIFDFIMFREGIELGKAIGKIKHFVNDIAPTLKNEGRYEIKPSHRIPMGDGLMPHFGIKAIDNKNPEEGILNFLDLRSIPKDVLTNKNFANHIFFRSYENHYGYKNTDLCFPITSPSEKNFVGFFSVNQYAADQASFKQILGLKNDGLWFSGFDKTKPLDKFYIMESPIDAISHYYLNPQLEGQNVLYSATIGSISTSQVKTMDLVINTYKPLQVHPSCDRDTEGQKFNLFIASQSGLKKDNIEKFQVFFQSNKHHVAEMTLNVNSNNLEGNILLTSKVKKLFEEVNDKLLETDIDKKPFNIHIDKINDEQAIVKTDFHSNARNWNALTNLVIDTKFDDSVLWKIDLAVNKDFNHDLQMSKLAYSAELAEQQSLGINHTPSIREFLVANYKMDGSKNELFLDQSKGIKDFGAFLSVSRPNTTDKGNSMQL